MIQIKVYTDDISFQYQTTNQGIFIPDQDNSTVLVIQNVSPLNTNNSVLVETIQSYTGLFQNMATLNDYITKSVIYQLDEEAPGTSTILQLYSFYHVPGDYVQYLYKTQQIPLPLPVYENGFLVINQSLESQQVLKTWQEIKDDFDDNNYPLLKIEVPNFNHYIEPLV
jgi:hypothetical protein